MLKMIKKSIGENFIKSMHSLSDFSINRYHSHFSVSYNRKLIRAKYICNMAIAYFIKDIYPDHVRFIMKSHNNPDYSVFNHKIIWVDEGDYFINLGHFNFMIISLHNEDEKVVGDDVWYNTKIEFKFYGKNHSIWHKLINEKFDEIREKIKNDLQKSDNVYIRYNVGRITKDKYIKGYNIQNVIHSRKDELISNLDKFLKSEEIYSSCGIPYKLCVLLYGNPGTGKSTMIKSIANHFKKSIHQLDISNIEKMTDVMNRFYLIEEVDLELQKLDTNSDSEYEVDSDKLKKLMGYIDNIPYGSVLFMTTNYIDRIPWRLLRDGRIDLKIEFGDFGPDEIKNMVNIFGFDVNDVSDIIKSVEVNGLINPAKLQNQLRLLKMNELYS